MNNKGQVALLGLALGVFIILLGLGLINPIKSVVDTTRASDQLDCNNASISDGSKITCLAVDLLLPYFIVAVLSLGGVWITSRLI